MKKSRFSEEKVISILKELEAGAKMAELCRRHGVADATIHRWRRKDGGQRGKALPHQWAIEELNLGPHAYQACALTT